MLVGFVITILARYDSKPVFSAEAPLISTLNNGAQAETAEERELQGAEAGERENKCAGDSGKGEGTAPNHGPVFNFPALFFLSPPCFLSSSLLKEPLRRRESKP